MSRRWFKRRLIHTADIAPPQTTRDGGELQVTYGSESTIDCRFYAFNERWTAEGASRQVFRQHRLLMDDSVSIGRRYRVQNIQDQDGTVIDAGPFVVTEVLKRTGRSGVHHIQIEMERSD